MFWDFTLVVHFMSFAVVKGSAIVLQSQLLRSSN